MRLYVRNKENSKQRREPKGLDMKQRPSVAKERHILCVFLIF